MAADAVRLLVITGSMGSGKTTVLGEASDLLASQGITHAAIDADALANGHLPAGVNLKDGNLRAMVQNYILAGVRMFLVAEAVESRRDLESIHEAAGTSDIVVCRLRAPLNVMQQRVRVREPGLLQQTFLERVVSLEALLDAVSLEDFSLTNDEHCSVTAVATELLVRIGWLASAPNPAY